MYRQMALLRVSLMCLDGLCFEHGDALDEALLYL